MQKTTDAYKLKENAHLFLDKPLNALLKEIVPEIKMAFVEANRVIVLQAILFSSL